MSWQAALGAAAGQFAGSLLGGKKGPSMGKQLEYQWRNVYEHPTYAVQGAKKAGIHPLYYLGNTPQWQPMQQVGDSSQMSAALGNLGSAVGQYANQQSNKAQTKALFDANLINQAGAARLSFAQAQYYESLTAQVQQKTNSQQDVAKLLTQAPRGSVQTVPDTVVSRSKGQTETAAGAPPAWRKLEIGPGIFIDWPQGSPMTADELTSPGTVLMLLRNMGFLQEWKNDPKKVTERTMHHFKRRGMSPRKRYYDKLQGNW